jgi:hypothetical protein
MKTFADNQGNLRIPNDLTHKKTLFEAFSIIAAVNYLNINPFLIFPVLEVTSNKKPLTTV